MLVAKQQVMREELRAEVERLTALLAATGEQPPAPPATTPVASCARRCASCVVSFPVYRTYVRQRVTRPAPADRFAVGHAVGGVARAPCGLDAELVVHLGRLALLEAGDDGAERRVRAAAPAAHGAGDGQGRRGHGLLPLPPAGLPQRGRR